MSKWLRDVAVGADGRVYIADSAHGRIVVLARDGAPLRTWGIRGTRRGEMTLPLAVATNRQGDVVVVATYGIDSPIYRFGPAFGYRGSWLDGGRMTVGHHWFAPTAAALGPDGSVWVTDRDNDVVRHLSDGGAFLGTLGSVGPDPLAYPEGVAAGPGGDVYVADTQHNRIVRLTPGGRVVGSFGARGPRSQRLRLPTALAVAPDGEVYVADSAHNRIAVFGADGRFVAAWGGAGSAPGRFEDPAGIAVGAHGRVFVSDRGDDRVQELSARGRFLTRWGAPGAGVGELGHAGWPGDRLPRRSARGRHAEQPRRGLSGRCGCERLLAGLSRGYRLSHSSADQTHRPLIGTAHRRSPRGIVWAPVHTRTPALKRSPIESRSRSIGLMSRRATEVAAFTSIATSSPARLSSRRSISSSR